MGRSVSEAAAQAVRKSEKSKAVDRTPEQVLADIRRNIAARLAVTPLDTALLLAQYDSVSRLLEASAATLAESDTTIASQDKLITDLQAQIEQFRIVYEAENRSQAVKVEKVIPYPDSEYVVMEGDICGD